MQRYLLDVCLGKILFASCAADGALNTPPAKHEIVYYMEVNAR